MLPRPQFQTHERPDPLRVIPGTDFVLTQQTRDLATVRLVKVGVTEGDSAAIESGVSPTELVVVDGAERLREGSRVAPTPRRAP